MSFILQQPEEFWSDFIQHTKQAKNRIYIRVMTFEAGEKTKELTEILKQKLQENVRVYLFVDWVNSRYVHGEIDLLPELWSKRLKRNKIQARTKQLLAELTEAGAMVSITNTPSKLFSLLPISGRNHTKIYIADETVWVGGMHPIDAAFKNIDFMVKMDSPEIVSIFKNYKASSQDQIIPVGDKYDTQILFDGGRKIRSCIYDLAISEVQKAQNEVVFMSQFLPEGKLLNKLIAKAKSGVMIKIITSTQEAGVFTKFPANITYRIFRSKIKRQKNMKIIHCAAVVHAKLIVVDKNQALFGSHNFISTGVWLGTQEVCITTKNQQLVKDFLDFVGRSTACLES